MRPWAALRTLKTIALIFLGLLAALVAAGFVAMKTDLLLSDIRPDALGDEASADATLASLSKGHGDPERWKSKSMVRLSLEGNIPFLPARVAFGIPDPRVELEMRFVPSKHGHYEVERLESGDLSVSGPMQTSTNRDGIGLVLDSVRHLFELPLTAQDASVRRHVAPAMLGGVEHQRVFLSWGTPKPQSRVDQLILWIHDGWLHRFDTTGRDITPFTKARVEYEGRYELGEFTLPERVRIFGLAPGSRLIHEWRLLEAELDEGLSTAKQGSGSDLSLFYLAKSQNNGCELIRHDAKTGDKVMLATLPGACDVTKVAWSPDTTKIVALQDDDGARAHVVDVAAKHSAPVSLPSVAGVEEVAIDTRGQLVAMVAQREDQLEKKTTKEGSVFVFEGKEYDIVGDGLPGLVHAYEQKGEEWARVETRSSSFDWDYAMGIDALEITKKLGARSTLFAYDRSKMETLDKRDDDDALLLIKAEPERNLDEGEWVRFQTEAGTIFAWGMYGETVHPTTPLYWFDTSRKPVRLPGLSADEEQVSVSVRGDYVLVKDFEQHASVYDAREKKLVLALEGVYSAMFWPLPNLEAQ